MANNKKSILDDFRKDWVNDSPFGERSLFSEANREKRKLEQMEQEKKNREIITDKIEKVFDKIVNVSLLHPSAQNIKFALSRDSHYDVAALLSSIGAEMQALISEAYLKAIQEKMKTPERLEPYLSSLISFIPACYRPTQVKALYVKDPDDALTQLKQLKEEGYIIRNLLIDSHGTHDKASFTIGGIINNYSSDPNFKGRFNATDDINQEKWRILGQIGELIEENIILTACYAGSKRHDHNLVNLNRTFSHLMGDVLLKKVNQVTNRSVYGPASWYLSNPLAYVNMPQILWDHIEQNSDVYTGLVIEADLMSKLKAKIEEGYTRLSKKYPNLRNTYQNIISNYKEQIESLSAQFEIMIRTETNEAIQEKLPKIVEALHYHLGLIGPISPSGQIDIEYYGYRGNIFNEVAYQYEYDNIGVWYRCKEGVIEKLKGCLFFWFNGEISFTNAPWKDSKYAYVYTEIIK